MESFLMAGLLRSTARGSMRVSVQSNLWSRSINLESLGLHGSFYVLGPPQAVGRGIRTESGTDESIVHFDCERVIAPRGYSPRRGRYVARSAGQYCRMWYGLELED